MISLFPWRKDTHPETGPIFTPEEQARLQREAEEKLRNAQNLQREVSLVTNSLRRRDGVNHYAHGIASAYGVELPPVIEPHDFESFLILIGNLEVLSYLIPLLLFIGFYWFKSPWRSTPLGQALMYQKASFLLVIIVIILSIFFPNYFGRGAVRIVIYAGVLVSLWVDFGNLLRYQRMGKIQKKQQSFLDESTKPREKPRR